MLAAMRTDFARTVKVCKRPRSGIRNCCRRFHLSANSRKILQRSRFASCTSKTPCSFAANGAIRATSTGIMRSAQYDFCGHTLASSRARMLRVRGESPGRARRSARSSAMRHTEIYDPTENHPCFMEGVFGCNRGTEKRSTTPAGPGPFRNPQSPKAKKANQLAQRTWVRCKTLSPPGVSAAHIFHLVTVGMSVLSGRHLNDN